jgi:hypothetical protein
MQPLPRFALQIDSLCSVFRPQSQKPDPELGDGVVELRIRLEGLAPGGWVAERSG